MSTTVTQRRVFNVDDYYRMATSGILKADDRVELIDGEILEMSPSGSRHAACVKRLNRLLGRLLGDESVIGVQDPVRLSDFSEPEPDVAVLRPKDDFYASGHPTPDDVLWLIEVADTSIDFDRQVKLPLYARHGVPEVWILDLATETVEIHREPSPAGFAQKKTFRRGEQIEVSLSGALVPVDDVLGQS